MSSLFASERDQGPKVTPLDTVNRLMGASGAAHDSSRARTPARWMPSSPPRRTDVNERLEAEYESAYDEPFLAPLGVAHGGGAGQPVMPRVKQPLRVEPPQEYNCPPRIDLKMSADDENLSSLHQIAELSTRVAKKAPRRNVGGGEKASAERLRDFAMLAHSARRAGQPNTAGVQAFKQGLLFDNVADYSQAIKCYKHFLEACLESGDAVGEALACNSIGVDYQLLGASYARQAVQYHTKHLEVADIPGKYIAHVNLGLCYATLDMSDEAVAHHQHALRYAIRMCSLAGESLACGNLGMVAGHEDIPTAIACAERQLQLARTLNDSRGKGDAYRQLGVLSNLQGSHDEAVHYFQQAMQLAQAEGDELVSNSARCAIGVAKGNAGFDAFLRSLIAEAAEPESERSDAQ